MTGCNLFVFSDQTALIALFAAFYLLSLGAVVLVARRK